MPAPPPKNSQVMPVRGDSGSPSGRRDWFPFAAAAFALAVLLAGTNVPTPLYPLYQRVFGFPPLVVTLVFAAYAIVLIPSLLVFGPLSDAIGRRRVLVPAVGAAIVGSALFAAAAGTGWLFAARAVQGLALGAVQATATAALVETEPTHDVNRAALAGTVATTGGSAAGPLLGGLLAQYAPQPRVLPYLVEIALLVIALLGLWRWLPADTGNGQRWRPRRPAVPAPIRRTFLVAGISAFLAWAVTALFLALMPSYVTSLLHTDNLALAGGVVALMLGASTLAQLLLRRLPSLAAQALGLLLLIAGLGGVLAAARTGSVVVVVVATVLAGLGQGLAFGGALAEVNAIAPADRKAEVLSAAYVVIYLGVALPIIGVGFLALATGLLGAVQIFAYIVAAAAVAGLIVQLVDRRRPDRLAPAT